MGSERTKHPVRSVPSRQDSDYQTQIFLVEFSLLLFRNRKHSAEFFIKIKIRTMDRFARVSG
jgi:hypothetical protein